MKGYWLILFLLVFQGIDTIQASRETPPLITLNAKQALLADILVEIEKQTGNSFTYESSLLHDLPLLSFRADKEPFEYCLKRLLNRVSLTYTISGQYIILKRKPTFYTISGFVRDSASAESLINASLFESLSGGGTITNVHGFYSITLSPGKVDLRTSYVGYEGRNYSFNLNKDTLIDITLKASENLGEVVVEGLNPGSEVLSSRIGVAEIPAQRIKSLPALLGETDVVKTLQRLPGVAVGTEGMSGMFVRGGDADGNLYLLDGNPIYHTNHLLGFFSAFNPDAVKSATFYKGSFPAEYGGRLSSVIDVRTNDGDRKEYHGNLSVGLLALRANLEGPIIKDKSSFNVSVRRTWMELITWPLFTSLNKGEDTKMKGGYHFFDMNAKVNHSFTDKSRLYLSFYMGSDSYRDAQQSETKEHSDLDFRWRWGNLIGSAGWNYVISNKLFASFTAGYTRYRSHIIQEKEEYVSYINKNDRLTFGQKSNSRSSMEDVSLRASFDYRPHVNHRIRMGGDYLFHNFRPEQNTMRSWYKDSVVEQGTNTVYTNSLIQGHEASLYAEDEMRVDDRLTVNAGLRYTLFRVQGETYQSLQPRLSGRYMLTRRLSAKLSYSKMNQYIHLLSDGYVSQPTDIWVPVTRRIRPMSAHQFTGGLCFALNKMFDFSAEAYYKQMYNLTEYKDNLPSLLVYPGWEEQVGLGRGRSYGTEWMVKKKTGKLTGWVGYTLSWSDRWFPDGSVNKGRRYPAKYDNRHKIDIVGTYRISKKVELTAAWMYASGNRMTIMDQKYVGGVAGSSRNNYQLPPYHRLDLGANFYRYKKEGRMGIWNFSLCNAYLQPNTYSARVIHYDGKVKLEKTILFMCLPSVSYTYKF